MLSALSLSAVVRPLRAAGTLHPLRHAEAQSDEELVGRALGGDRWAEEALYRRHVRAILGMVTRLLRRHADVEDIVQDTFAIALAQLGDLREPGAFRGWLAQIAVSQVRRHLRRQRLRRLLGLETPPEDAPLDALASRDASPEVRAELSVLDGVLAALPAEHRIAWSLRYIEGESLEQVAQIAGCSLATAKRRIAAASQRVDQHVTLEGAS